MLCVYCMCMQKYVRTIYLRHVVIRDTSVTYLHITPRRANILVCVYMLYLYITYIYILFYTGDNGKVRSHTRIHIGKIPFYGGARPVFSTGMRSMYLRGTGHKPPI